MAGYQNFVPDAYKHKKGTNLFKKRKNVSKLKDFQTKDERMRTQIKKWTTFYRLNIHRFVEHYFGIQLYLFQKILLFFMNINTFFMLVAARGASKSFLIAIFVCARCVLYPGTKVVIASGVKKQAKLIITEKIEKELYNRYPNLAREIKQIKTSANEATVIFHNGSSIEAITASDTSRGYRGNILILEEFRLIDENILKSVLKPILNVNRQPPYLKKEEYKHLAEENIEIYISSAWYTDHWMWNAMKAARDRMLKGMDTVIFALDYLVSIHHGLLSKKRVREMRESPDFDEISFQIEYENIMYAQSSNALFKLKDINKNRKLKNAFYPIKNVEYVSQKNKRKPKLRDGEIRILGVDVALMGGKENDTTVITCMRLIPNGNHYLKKVSYIETLEGAHSETQAIRIKQLFEDFQASYVALDTHGNAMSVYDELVKVNYDEERDVEYEAWCSFNDEEMMKRAKTPNPLPVVFSIKAGARTNHEIATYLRTDLQNSNIELLVSEIEARDILSDKKYFQEADPEERAEYLRPFVQTTMLVNELVNLDHDIVGGYIRVKEKSGKRKDRYSSLGYCNYLARYLENEKLKSEYNSIEFDDSVVIF